MKIGYLMSRFPKLTETFIVNEVTILLNKGVEVYLYPINKETPAYVQPRAKDLFSRVYYTALFSPAIFMANLRQIFTRPVTYTRVWLKVISQNITSLNFLLGAIAYYPKAVHLAKLCKKHNITHIHAHFASHPAMVAYVINQLTGISYSFTAHGSDLHKRQAMLAEKYRCAEFAVMISEYNKRFFIEKVGQLKFDKLHVVRCGIDPAQFEFNAKVKLSEPVQILCVAALREVKGHKYLVKAAQVLKDARINFQMSFVGDGPKRNELAHMISEMGLTNEVVLHGAKTSDEVAELMKNADIFVLGSYQTSSGNREGIPVVIMEAMASGTPVVASNVSGIPELVIHQKTGLLANPQDSQDFADKLRQLIEEHGLALQLAKNAAHFVTEEYDLEKNVAKLHALFCKYQRMAPHTTTDSNVL